MAAGNLVMCWFQNKSSQAVHMDAKHIINTLACEYILLEDKVPILYKANIILTRAGYLIVVGEGAKTRSLYNLSFPDP